jgi:hypothetical protein
MQAFLKVFFFYLVGLHLQNVSIFRMYQLTLKKQSGFLPPNTKQHNEAHQEVQPSGNIALKRADRLPTKVTNQKVTTDNPNN